MRLTLWTNTRQPHNPLHNIRTWHPRRRNSNIGSPVRDHRIGVTTWHIRIEGKQLLLFWIIDAVELCQKLSAEEIELESAVLALTVPGTLELTHLYLGMHGYRL